MRTIEELERRLEDTAVGFEEYHTDMANYVLYYKYSAFYPRKNSNQPFRRYKANLLKAFADKNKHYLANMPKFKIPNLGSNPLGRQKSDILEKLLYATWEYNGLEQLHTRWSNDGTKRSALVSVLDWDKDAKMPTVRRVNPEYCWWQMGNKGDGTILDFFIVTPMTKDQIKEEYGVTPTGDGLSPHMYLTEDMVVDGREWVLKVEWYHGDEKAVFAGRRWIEKPHKHKLGVFPVELAFLEEDDEHNGRGDFFLRSLIPLQCELNESIYRKANIIRKLGNPAIIGKGVLRNQKDDIKDALAGEGGFVGLKPGGDLDVLQLQETRMIDTHIEMTIDMMMKISGFGQASFGESVGANTSGDALGMYFTPTTRSIQTQLKNLTVFYKSLNAKIFTIWENRLKTGQERTLTGYLPRGRFYSVDNSGDSPKSRFAPDASEIVITKDVVRGHRITQIEWPEIAPKDDVAFKRLLVDAVANGVMSKDTALEYWGVDSPGDEVEKIEAETSNPGLNPTGNAELLKGVASMNQAEQAGMQPGMQSPMQENMPEDAPFPDEPVEV